MKTTFKAFLKLTESNNLFEGGDATKKWETSRAKKEDIDIAITFVYKATGIDKGTLKDNLLGSTRLVAIGEKADSGDIDIAIDINKYDSEELNSKMLAATDNQAKLNKGLKIGSFAVPVGNKKKVQVDLVFVKNVEWAKFAYYSSEGKESKYKGATRNIILSTIISKIQTPGEDFVKRDENDNVIAKATRSMRLTSGLERVFKVAPMRKDGKGRTKTLQKVDPERLKKELESIDKSLINNFSTDPDIKTNPDDVAKFIFGSKFKAKDIMTVEEILKNLHNLDKKLCDDIIETVKIELKKANLPIPSELD